jgi:pimeloyl-ACP methyl ester carboxylesterase
LSSGPQISTSHRLAALPPFPKAQQFFQRAHILNCKVLVRGEIAFIFRHKLQPCDTADCLLKVSYCAGDLKDDDALGRKTARIITQFHRVVLPAQSGPETVERWPELPYLPLVRRKANFARSIPQAGSCVGKSSSDGIDLSGSRSLRNGFQFAPPNIHAKATDLAFERAICSPYLRAFPALMRRLSFLFLSFALTACATLKVRIDHQGEVIEVRKDRSFASSEAASNIAAGEAAALYNSAQDLPLTDERRMTLLLASARALLASGESSPAAQQLYNGVIRQLVAMLGAGGIKDRALRGGGGVTRIMVLRTGKDNVDPGQWDSLVPASDVRIERLHERSLQPGWGVPYVAYFSQNAGFIKDQPGSPRAGMCLPVTALVTFRDGSATLRFVNTLKTDNAVLAGRTMPLAADYSAAIAVLLSHTKNRSIDIGALLFTRQRISDLGLFQLEPYDPSKIPVVFVHGLLSRPEAWTQAINGLLGDPTIRKKYQFWLFLYPTGLPVWRSAAGLRDELDRFETPSLDDETKRQAESHNPLVGHSMGGLICSTMIREGGEKLWRRFSDIPASEVRLSPEAKRELLKLLYFSPRSDVSRVIFVSTPHRGSGLALRPIAGFFASLIQLPFSALMAPRERSEILRSMRDDVRSAFVAPANSIRFLRARSPLLEAILQLPMSRSIAYHSIIGDRGRGNSPKSSDGVVPYWSSHLDGAASEKIVPSGHGANEHSEGIAEIRRILLDALSDNHLVL